MGRKPNSDKAVQGLDGVENEETTIEVIDPKMRNNAKLDRLHEFDYEKLDGDSYAKLMDYLFGEVVNPYDPPRRRQRAGGVMRDNDKYIFEQYRCTPIRRPIYPDLDNSPYVVKGIKLQHPKPTREVNTQWKYVKDAFTQLEPNFSNKQETNIFLPKKP